MKLVGVFHLLLALMLVGFVGQIQSCFSQRSMQASDLIKKLNDMFSNNQNQNQNRPNQDRDQNRPNQDQGQNQQNQNQGQNQAQTN